MLRVWRVCTASSTEINWIRRERTPGCGLLCSPCPGQRGEDGDDMAWARGSGTLHVITVCGSPTRHVASALFGHLPPGSLPSTLDNARTHCRKFACWFCYKYPRTVVISAASFAIPLCRILKASLLVEFLPACIRKTPRSHGTCVVITSSESFLLVTSL